MTVFMYHGVGTPVPEGREIGADLYDVKAEAFRRQMQWLKDKGYTSVIRPTPIQVLDKKAVMLTFDDGEKNNVTQALPVLQEMGFKAYFFVIVQRVGQPGYLTWDDVRALHQAGMIVGSHGLTHTALTGLKESELEAELVLSKKEIEEKIGAGIESLSIPRGFFNWKIKVAALKAGYKEVFISDLCGTLGQGCFPRTAVKAGWTLKRFSQAARGRVPLREGISGGARRALKVLLGESRYNCLREKCLRR